MNSTRIARRSSLRTPVPINHLSSHSSSGSSDEGNSADSGSVYKPNSSSSTSSEPDIPSAASDELKMTESASADEHTASEKRMTRSHVKSRSRPCTKTELQNAPLVNESTGPDQTKQLNYSSPLYRYLTSCRLKGVTSVKRIAINCFSQSVESLRGLFLHAVHPFAFHDGIVFKEEFNARQAVLFPINVSWQPYSHADELGCLPEPYLSPLITSQDQHQASVHYTRLRRFEFSKEHGLIYVGGFVKSITWCPTRMFTDNIGMEKRDSMYIAVSTYPSPATRFSYADPAQTHSGLIQIWNCGDLRLSGPPQVWQPEPHLLIAHEWGHVTDMCWLPLSITLVARMPKTLAGKLVCSPSQFSPSPLIHRTLGHLIIACQDGIVRVIAIPRLQMDPIYFQTRRRMPLYKLIPKAIMKLSPCASKAVDWIGWPTRLHIRAEFPNRLFVGYSRGHVAYYDLSCVHPLLFTASECHLSPVRLFRLINGPVRCLSLNPVNGRMLMVQGLDTGIRVWDLEDTASNITEAPEMAWRVNYGTAGSNIMWHSRGDTIFISRECIARKQDPSNKKGAEFENLADLITRLDNALCQTMWEAPSIYTRILVPLGLQSVTHIDLSEPLNALLCATDRGRIELVLFSMDGRFKPALRYRYLGQIRFPICQWSPSPRLSTESIDGTIQTYQDFAAKLLASKNRLLPLSEASVPTSTWNINDFTDPSCPDCHSDRSMCWHKLWTHHKLTIFKNRYVPAKPYIDYQKTPLLSISQAAFCPNPQAATWIAAGTACGFVQLIHADMLYLRDFDELLSQPAGELESFYLSVERAPQNKPISSSGYSSYRPRKPPAAFNGKDHAQQKTRHRASNGEDTYDELNQLLDRKLRVSAAPDQEDSNESSSHSSDATEAMGYEGEACLDVRKADDDSDQTEPCYD